MITKEIFGNMPCGAQVDAYTLTNENGASVTILTMGGIMQKLMMPDRDGNLADVICGFDTVEGYLTGGGYQGALIGRYGNRIAKGRFTLNGVTYQLAINNGENHLHGGKIGFNKKIWSAVPVSGCGFTGLILKMTAEDGEENYPGKLDVTVTYTLTDKNELSIRYEAVSDKDTVCNMTNHSYFNMAGYQSGSMLDQILWIDSDEITEVGDGLIPTGKGYPVAGTPFDFNTPTKIGARMFDDDPQLKLGGGIDHNYVLKGEGMRKVAELWDETSGRCMACITDQPGVQIYSGCQMDSTAHPFKGGIKQQKFGAICLETQHAPDSPNQPTFPTTTLKAGEKYDTTTVYAFSVK